MKPQARRGPPRPGGDGRGGLGGDIRGGQIDKYSYTSEKASAESELPAIGQSAWTGQKKKYPERRSRLFFDFSINRKERRKMFEMWHAYAMRIACIDGVNIRLLAVLWRFFNHTTCSMWPTNRTLARCAGECTERTIQNDINIYRKIGLIQTRDTYKTGHDGKRKNRREILPAVPVDVHKLVPRSAILDEEEADLG